MCIGCLGCTACGLSYQVPAARIANNACRPRSIVCIVYIDSGYTEGIHPSTPETLATMDNNPTPRTVVILPAYNEALTITQTVQDFLREGLEVVVVDNASTDETARLAAEAGAHRVLTETLKGKGRAVRKAFQLVDADIYVLADADATYPAQDVHNLIAPIKNGAADMTVGDRLSNGRYAQENKRPGHNLGNAAFNTAVNLAFDGTIQDVLSGYRAFSRRFVKTYPCTAKGFDLEVNLTAHALNYGMPVVEVPIGYQDRPSGSESKLNTVRDGVRILWALSKLYARYRPVPVGLLAAALASLAAAPVVCAVCIAGTAVLAGLAARDKHAHEIALLAQ